MQQFRTFALMLLLLYSGMIVGFQFHNHPAGQDQLTPHCKSCQISQSVYDQVQTKELLPSLPVHHFQQVLTVAPVSRELEKSCSGRAPPAC